ncbi:MULTISPECIES: DUF5993 family protein [Loigolactobacillus]|uniref:DUF5993 family protein n=1 Tax=Loigolactobacillus TaxID=2767889 RepID=UPI000A8C48CC|nr:MULTISPECIES: DUF5993 family protein [Loigolactobacillus]
MDIIILFIIAYLYYLLAIKQDTSNKILVLFGVVLVLCMILFKLHATSSLPISL